jgi:hypothetical protein
MNLTDIYRTLPPTAAEHFHQHMKHSAIWPQDKSQQIKIKIKISICTFSDQNGIKPAIHKSNFRNHISKGLGMVVHTCNPSYLRSRDQEDCGSKPARAKSKQELIPINKPDGTCL